MTESNRLAKLVAEQFACSRREATLYIEGGWISVDGVMVEEAGARIEPGQTIARLPGATLLESSPVTILLHQPPALSAALPGRRDREFDLAHVLPALSAEAHSSEDKAGTVLKRHLRGLTLCTELDAQTGGLLVLTQDWAVARKLVDDSARVEHEIIVDVAGELAPNGMALLNSALVFKGRPQAPAKVSWQNEGRLRFAIKGVQSGQIAHMCAQAGLRALAMKRIRVGRVPMAGLAVGQWRYLAGYERF